VGEHNTAPHTGKLSTPSMIRAMEQASQRAVLDYLPPEQSTVGFEVNVRHVATADMGVPRHPGMDQYLKEKGIIK